MGVCIDLTAEPSPLREHELADFDQAERPSKRRRVNEARYHPGDTVNPPAPPARNNSGSVSAYAPYTESLTARTPRLPFTSAVEHITQQPHTNHFTATSPLNPNSVGMASDYGFESLSHFYDIDRDSLVDSDYDDEFEELEQIDLTETEDGASLKQAQEEQRIRHEKLKEQQAQQAQSKALLDAMSTQGAGERRSTSIGKLQCVICMEDFTNITATHCGKYYKRSGVFRACPCLLDRMAYRVCFYRSSVLSRMHLPSSACG